MMMVVEVEGGGGGGGEKAIRGPEARQGLGLPAASRESDISSTAVLSRSGAHTGRGRMRGGEGRG